VNRRPLRLVAFPISDIGIVLIAVTFVLRLGLDSIVSLFAVSLMAAGLVLFLRWGCVESQGGKMMKVSNTQRGPLLLNVSTKFASETHFSSSDHY